VPVPHFAPSACPSDLPDCLAAVADSMREALLARCVSPLAQAGLCAAALFLPDGRLIAPGRRPLPLLAGSLGPAVQGILGEFPAHAMEPGDGFISNDPWRGGSRLPEIVLLRPVFAHGEVRALAACTLHHQDVGGMTAGSLPPAATSVHQEGLRIPPVRLFRAEQTDIALFRLLCTNSRTPDQLAGDVRTQWSVLQAGEEALQLLLDAPAAFLRECEAAIVASEAAVRRTLRHAPDGEYRFSAARDPDNPGAGNEPLRVPVLLRKQGDRLVIDLTGCATQGAGPANASRAAVWSAVSDFARGLAPRAAANAGCTAPLQLRTAPGTIVDPAFPAAVNGSAAVVEMLSDALRGAWAQVQAAERGA
jgi:N-methylhydantoinase B